MAATSSITYDPFGINGGTSGVGKGTTATNSTGGTGKSNAGRMYDPFNIGSVQAVPNPNPQKQQVQQKQVAPQKQSLLNKVTSVGKSLGSAAVSGERTVATGVARILPGGTADIQAQQQQSQQASKDLAFVKQQQAAGKIPNAQAGKLIQAISGSAGQAATAQAKTIKSMPTTGQLAAGFGSTAADILTAGSLPELKGGSLLAKTTNIATKAGSYGASGALNAAAGGGTKKQVEENAVAGAALPGAVHLLGKVVAKGASAVGDKLATSDGKVATAINNTKSLLNSSQPAKDLVQNQRVKSLIEAGQKQQEAEAPPLQMKAAVNQDHVAQGLIKPEVSQTPVKDIAISADNVHKVDSQKVAQYVKQVKDGEPIEPIVVHNVNGQTHIVDGQQRLAAAQKLGITEVPTVEKVPGATPIMKESMATDTKEPTVAEQGGQRPANEIQTAIEQAHNAGDTAKVGQLITQLPDDMQSPMKSALGIKEDDKIDTAPIKQQIQDLKNDDKNYDTNGNLTPEVGKQITTLNKQLNAAGERVPKAEKPVTVTSVDDKVNSVESPTIKTSKLANRVEAIGLKKNLTEAFSNKPEYAKVNMQKQAESATDLLKTDPERLIRIAMGHERPPEGLLPESAWVAAVEHATKSKDGELMRKLGTESHLVSEASGMGQRIRVLGELNKDNAATHIKAVAKARADAATKKLGKPVAKATSDEIKQIRAATPKISLTPKSWSDFVESIKC